MPEFVQFQGHDFSMRGMGALESAILSGSGHLLPFVGSDTIPAILYLENVYNADIEHELVGCSVHATEHSVSCAGGATYGMVYAEVEEEYDEAAQEWVVVRYLTAKDLALAPT
jgi:nicotinamide phosphoribosyltransferase